MLGFPDRYFAHCIWSNHDAKYMFSANFQTNNFTYTTSQLRHLALLFVLSDCCLMRTPDNQ